MYRLRTQNRFTTVLATDYIDSTKCYGCEALKPTHRNGPSENRLKSMTLAGPRSNALGNESKHPIPGYLLIITRAH